MKRGKFTICAMVLLLGLFTVRAWADAPSLQDMSFYVNGTTLSAGSDASFAADAAKLGINLSGFNLSTGLGKIVFTGTALGPGNFNAWFDEQVSTPFYNEFGATSGTPGSGVSWEIGDSWASNIFNDAAGGSLTNSNSLPIGASNYLNNCTGACNGDVSGALGQAYSLASGNKEIITILVSQTAPSGFYLDLVHPVDDNNPSRMDVYYDISATQVPNGGGGGGEAPEPGTLLLMLTGAGAAAARLRRRLPSFRVLGFVLAGLLATAALEAQTVKTVPWDPTNPAAPHTAYPGANIVLGATFDPAGSTDTFQYSWNFGDGTPVSAPANLTNVFDISARHVYAGTTVGQIWTAVVTVTDTNSSAQYTGKYLVIWENNTLQSRVNVAIDRGLWYLHQSMYRNPGGTVGNQGFWSDGCASGYSGFACNGYGSLDATNVQAFEVNGHLPTGPATDPYTQDVKWAIDHMLTRLSTATVQPRSYTYNTAAANTGCSDGTAPQPGGVGGVCPSSTKFQYNPTGTDCSAGCSYTFDANSDGLAVFAQQTGQSWGYEDGMYADALVASSSPNSVASTGAVSGMKYKDIVQDIADAASYCQYGGDDYDVAVGYARGSEPYQGGGWWYNCRAGDDNSVSQWAAIGLIGALRGFGLAIPKIVTDANNMWVTASQDVRTADQPVSGRPDLSWSDDFGALGYNGAFNYSNAWGPFATTPSGMVQMSLDGIGRTKNMAFGDATTDHDQRFNNAETFYADNFCNSLTGNYAAAYYTPRNYVYGLFSFTKAMLLHNPNGTLTPIQYMRTLTPGVFTTNPNVPPNTIDWYAALSPANGGQDPCDGVAQTIVQRQSAPGYWYGDNVSGAQYPYETAWSIIMLQRTVFVNCVNNLSGKGTPSGTSAPRIDLTWTGIPNVTGYDVLRSTTKGGPYMNVGNTSTTAYSDRTGLSNNSTYYYVLQPVNASGAVCQSNEATVLIPKLR